MGVQGINPQYQPTPLLSPESGRQEIYTVSKTFDSFQRAQAQPALETSMGSRLIQALFHPFQTFHLTRYLSKGSQDSQEGLFGRIKMYRDIRASLNRKGRKELSALLKSNVLSDNSAENGHSTLFQLYSILKTRRTPGLKNEKILEEVIKILNRPYTITQKFAPLSEIAAQQILQVRNNPLPLNRTGVTPAVRPLGWNDIKVKNSATCVSSSVMYYMADKSPSELARHLNEITSPMQAFYEKAKLSEISPSDPQQAFAILDQAKIKYTRTENPDELMIKVELPPAGYIRTVNASNRRKKGEARSGVEAAYQSALSFMATRRTYDPATDYRDSEIPGEMSKGLTEQEKTLMETIIKDNGGVMSITYQLATGKTNPQPDEEGLPFLYGYTRSFEQTTADIAESIKMDEPVTIGITDTDNNGAIVGGHEITITTVFVDEKDGEIKFKVVDSDDTIPTPVVRSARELIPRIHHAGMPLKLAQRIQTEIDKNTGYFIPTASDQTFYNPIQRTQDPLPADAFTTLEDVQASPTQEPIEGFQPVNTPETRVTSAPYVEYVPVYTMQPMPYYNPAAYTYPAMASTPQPHYYPSGYGY